MVSWIGNNQNQYSMGQTASSREIYLTIQAGQTQSQQLFDFNSDEVRVISNQLVTTNSLIAYDGDNLTYQAKGHNPNALYNVAIDFEQIEFQTSTENQKTLWRVLKQTQVYPLDMQTVVKLGKVKLRLKDIVTEQKEVTEKDLNSRSVYHDLADVKSVSAHSNASHQNQCRICFDTTNQKDNPLVCLCKCLGTVKYIHYICLRDWISNHVTKREHNNTLFYSYQQTKCEICKQFYQPEFIYEGRKFLLLDLQNAPSAPYAVFQSMQEDEENKRFSIFLIGLGEEEITIGRNSNSSVVMKQISISRNHCSLIYKNKILFIKDKGSKFGTLIKVEKEVEFNPMEGLSLQYESKLLTIKEKGKMNCCCVENDSFTLKINRCSTQRKTYSMLQSQQE